MRYKTVLNWGPSHHEVFLQLRENVAKLYMIHQKLAYFV